MSNFILGLFCSFLNSGYKPIISLVDTWLWVLHNWFAVWTVYDISDQGVSNPNPFEFTPIHPVAPLLCSLWIFLEGKEDDSKLSPWPPPYRLRIIISIVYIYINCWYISNIYIYFLLSTPHNCVSLHGELSFATPKGFKALRKLKYGWTPLLSSFI